MQKSKQTKTTHIDFCHLNDNNKTQFLEFLLMNNITFEKANGKNDYVAKVTVGRPMGKENVGEGEAKVKGKVKVKTNQERKPATSKRKKEQKVEQVNNVKVATPKKSMRIAGGTPLQEISVSSNNASFKSTNTANRSQQQRHRSKTKTPIKTTQFVNDEASLKIQTIKSNKSKSNTKILSQLNRSVDKVHEKSVRKSSKSPKLSSKSKKKVKFIEVKDQKSFDYQNQSYMNNDLSLQMTKQDEKQREKQKILQINTKIKRKTQEQKEIHELANKYYKTFDLKPTGQRPIKWQFSQLLKTIQQIYSQLFVKNTQTLTLKTQSTKTPSQNSNFIKFIKDYFMSKYKNQKMSTNNLINMLYSLSYYLQNQKRVTSSPSQTITKNIIKQIKASQVLTATGIFLQTFQDFICQIYEYEQLLFYLFIRSIVVGQAVKLAKLAPKKLRLQSQSINSSSNHSKTRNIFDKEIILNSKDITKILALILGQDQQLVREYQRIVYNYIHNLSGKSQCSEYKISGPELMTLLVEDYRRKRIRMEEEEREAEREGKEGKQGREERRRREWDEFGRRERPSSMVQHSVVEENTFEEMISIGQGRHRDHGDYRDHEGSNQHCLGEADTDELTFGQSTHQQLDYPSAPSFWHPQPPSLPQHPPSSLPALLHHKLHKKAHQLFTILLDNHPCPSPSPLPLLLHKSHALLQSLINMNKLQWFQQLHVEDPMQEDIQLVEELQLMYRELEERPDVEGIGRLCKRVLVVRQLREELGGLLGEHGQIRE